MSRLFSVIFSSLINAVLIILIFGSCERKNMRESTGTFSRESDSVRFYRLIKKGDSAYAEKLGFLSFSVAKRYYDSARLHC